MIRRLSQNVTVLLENFTTTERRSDAQARTWLFQLKRATPVISIPNPGPAFLKNTDIQQ
jgi:hypothetical protein